MTSGETGPHGVGDALDRLDLQLVAKLVLVLGAFRVEAEAGVLGHAPGGVDAPLVDDVEEEAVDLVAIAVDDLHRLLDHVVDVGGGEVELEPAAGLLKGAAPVALAVFVHLNPLGVGARGVLIPADGDVDGAADVGVMAGADLLAQQVAGEVGMPVREPRLVVDPTVVAAGEEGDAVDVGGLEGARERVGVEGGADAGKVLGGVEVEVDLAEAEFGVHAGAFGRLPEKTAAIRMAWPVEPFTRPSEGAISRRCDPSGRSRARKR